MKAALGQVTRVIDIPSSGVTYLRVEIPVEKHAEATTMFYGRRVLVTLTDLDMPFGIIDSDEEAKEHDNQIGGKNSAQPGPLCRSAVMVCQHDAFRHFVESEFGECDDLAEFIKEYCGVASRKELDTNKTAATRFHKLMADYRDFQEELLR